MGPSLRRRTEQIRVLEGEGEGEGKISIIRVWVVVMRADVRGRTGGGAEVGRVGVSLAALVNPVLYPGVGEVLRITQQELAYLVGLSRQRVNEALTALAAHDAIQVEYGGLRVINLQALRTQTVFR